MLTAEFSEAVTVVWAPAARVPLVAVSVRKEADFEALQFSEVLPLFVRVKLTDWGLNAVVAPPNGPVGL